MTDRYLHHAYSDQHLACQARAVAAGDIVANDTHGVVLVTSHGERGGQRLAVRAADIWHLAGGKATEHWSFAEDQAAFDKFFS